jgi:hypothetical protein
MDGSEKHVKSQTPICQPSEEAEGLADHIAFIVGSVPAPDGENAGEDVEGDQTAQASQ